MKIEAVNEVFARRLREARASRGWNQERLADEVTRIGHPIGRVTISKIEAGKRGVLIEEAIALAAALDVAPAHLLLPIDAGEGPHAQTSPAASVKLAPKLKAGQVKARRWFRGELPLHPTLENFEVYLHQTPEGLNVSTEDLSEHDRLGLLRRREQEVRRRQQELQMIRGEQQS